MNYHHHAKLRRPILWGKPVTMLKTSHWFDDVIHVKQDELICQLLNLASGFVNHSDCLAVGF